MFSDPSHLTMQKTQKYAVYPDIAMSSATDCLTMVLMTQGIGATARANVYLKVPSMCHHVGMELQLSYLILIIWMLILTTQTSSGE